MQFVTATRNDTELLAYLVSNSNKDVAELLSLNIENAPKHPSFCTPDWINTDFDRGQIYFLAVEDNVAKGCVAFEQPNNETAYLNRLSVLPQFRHRGIGSSLVQYVIDFSTSRQIKTISIGVIAEHVQIKDWYLHRGFTESGVQNFDHLPFQVLYMTYELPTSRLTGSGGPRQ